MSLELDIGETHFWMALELCLGGENLAMTEFYRTLTFLWKRWPGMRVCWRSRRLLTMRLDVGDFSAVLGLGGGGGGLAAEEVGFEWTGWLNGIRGTYSIRLGAWESRCSPFHRGLAAEEVGFEWTGWLNGIRGTYVSGRYG
ncbi:hypothetical protein AMTR_s00001p00270060, partial [Amborella trichopoda]